MKLKTSVHLLTLAFLAACTVVLVSKELAPRSPPEKGGQSPVAGTAQRVLSTKGDSPPLSGTSVIAYYFYGKIHCATCDRIGSYAKEAVAAGFPAELKAGRLQWRTVNYDEPGNEHFVRDYQIVAPCVVLVTLRDGTPVAWKGLPEVWDHFGQKAVFIRYIRDAVRASLAGDRANEGKGKPVK